MKPFLHFDEESNVASIDLEPYIREAMSKIKIRTDRATLELAATEMRKRGWIVVPPPADYDVITVTPAPQVPTDEVTILVRIDGMKYGYRNARDIFVGAPPTETADYVADKVREIITAHLNTEPAR